MADVYGELYEKAKIDRSYDGYNQLDVVALYDEYEASALEIGSTITVGDLRKEDIMIGGSVAFDALGASTTLSVGPSASPTKYKGATSTASAGTFDLLKTIAATAQETADDTLVLTTAGGVMTGTITVKVLVLRRA